MKVRVRSTTDGFRRAGIAFTREGVILDSESMTEAQREAIANEPRLSVSPVDEDGEGKAEKEAGSSNKAKAKGKATS